MSTLTDAYKKLEHVAAIKARVMDVLDRDSLTDDAYDAKAFNDMHMCIVQAIEDYHYDGIQKAKRVIADAAVAELQAHNRIESSFVRRA